MRDYISKWWNRKWSNWEFDSKSKWMDFPYVT